MDIEQAKEIIKELEEIFGSPNPFKDDKDYDRAVAIKIILAELDKKDKEIKELKQGIKNAMGKDRDCLTFGYHSAYVGLLDDLINIIEED